jgi:hypothetical protein
MKRVLYHTQQSKNVAYSYVLGGTILYYIIVGYPTIDYLDLNDYLIR